MEDKRVKPAEQLQDALERLEENGWVKGSYNAPEGRCSSGALIGYPAIGCTRDGAESAEKALEILARIIFEQFPDRANAGEYNFDEEELHDYFNSESVIINFNDHEDTTKEDVISMFEKAIAKAQEQT